MRAGTARAGETMGGVRGSPSMVVAVRRSLGALLWAWEHSLGWVIAQVLMVLIRGYQVAISPLFPPSCRFYPCCSSYGLVAIRVHGSLKGTVLTAWRLLRCNPWTRGGIDPVPTHGAWQPDILPDGRPRAPLQRADAAAD